MYRVVDWLSGLKVNKMFLRKHTEVYTDSPFIMFSLAFLMNSIFVCCPWKGRVSLFASRMSMRHLRARSLVFWEETALFS